MVVIADASPLNHLVLIDRILLLPRLFTEVFVPDAVLEELSRPETAPAVSRWAASRPDWVRGVADPPFRNDAVLDSLGRGEGAAIAFAQTVQQEVLLVIDDAKGRRVARQRRIPVIGILGVLETSAARNLIDLPDVLEDLRRTNFG